MDNSIFAGSNISKVKTHNLQALLMSLLYEGEISRSQLARRTSLSSATITNLATELIKDKIITEVSSAKRGSKNKRGVGRPQRKLRLIPDARYAIGVHIGVGLFRIAITNLFAEIIDNRIVEFAIDSPPEMVLEQIALEIESLIDATGIDPQRILGIGVGASGLVNHEKGLNVLAPRLGWTEVYIQKILEERLSLSVRVDNNVRTMAIGEAFFGVGREVNVLAFVYGRTGVGAGFVVNRQVFRGSGAGAGEIGHTIMVHQDGEPCLCGQKGCLETLVTEPVMIQKALQLAKEQPDSILARHLAENNGSVVIDRIFKAAREGDQALVEMIEGQVHYLGIALANLVNILNPEMILLGGVFAQGDDLIRPIVHKVIRDTAFCDLGADVIVQSTSFGWRAGVVGAAALALMDLFYQSADGSI